MLRQGHLVLDQFESFTKSEPACTLAEEQKGADYPVEEYQRVLKSLSEATVLYLKNVPEANEFFKSALAQVLYSRQIMRAKPTKEELLHEIEDDSLIHVSEQLHGLYERIITPSLPVLDEVIELPPEHTMHQSVHTNIVDELRKILSAALSQLICLHTERFREMRERIDQSNTVKEAYLVVMNAKHGGNGSSEQAELVASNSDIVREDKPSSWFAGFFSASRSPQVKSKLATKPNQTWVGGLFRKVVFDDFDKVYDQCMKVFEKYKDYDEVKQALQECSHGVVSFKCK